MPEPMVSVPESPLLLAVLIWLWLATAPPKTTEPVPPKVWAPTKLRVPLVEPLALPRSMVPLRVRPW